jgi:magnesium-transporting ATPase (P-type)
MVNMWDELRNDPFLRTISVLVIGILLFGLLFNTTAGGSSMMGSGEDMSRGNGYGYSFNSIIGGLLLVLIKILFIVLIGAVLIAAFVWIRNMFFRDNNSAMARAINNDPLLKTVVFATLGIIALFILFGLIGSFNSTGYMGGMSPNQMNGGYANGYNANLGIAWLLMMLIRVLSYILIISLAIALAIYLKSQYDKGNINWFTSKNTSRSTVNENDISIDENETIIIEQDINK